MKRMPWFRWLLLLALPMMCGWTACQPGDRRDIGSMDTLTVITRNASTTFYYDVNE